MNKQDSDKIKTIITNISDELMVLSEIASHVDPAPTPMPVPVLPPIPVPTPTPTPSPSPSLQVLTKLTAVECSNVNRQSTLISSGVPIAQSVGLKDVNRLAITDSTNKIIESDIRPTAYWPDGSIKWVQVELVDSIESGKQKSYSLCLVATSPSIKVLTIMEARLTDPRTPGIVGAAIVDTGSAVFTIGAEGLVRSLKTRDGLTLTGSPTSFTFDGKTDTFSDTQVRRMEFEYVGSLVCYLVIETISNTFTTGDKFGRISTTRRYRFVKNSSLATVTSVIRWEGTKNGTNHLMPDGKTVNGVLGTSWVDLLKIDPSLITVESGTTATSNYSVAQPLRSSRSKARSIKSEGSLASSFSLKDNRNKIVAGLQRMDLHEPQSINYGNGGLRIYHASDKFWLAHHQGVSTTCVVGVCDVNQSDANLLADMNHPVRLFCMPGYYEVAGKSIPATGIITVQSSNEYKYRSSLTQICNKTLERIDKDGLYGLMTYAWWPRSWDDSYIETGAESLTTWDGLYKTGAFTDYYSTSRSAVTLAFMTQNSLWLDNLAHPSALRMLYTQIMQTAPDDPWVYGGWSPAGYGCGRSDFNSSHSYYENLFWYCYLTGDRSVIDVISRGEERMIREVANQPLAGRFPHQRLRAWRFLSQCHYDAMKRKMFLDAWTNSMVRAINECYVESVYQSDKIAFWVDGQKKKGINITPNLYALSIWDLESLWEYGKDIPVIIHTGEIPNNHPWKLLQIIVSTIQRYGSTIVGGDSSFNKSAKWARAFSFTWDGQQTITNLKVSPDAENSGLMYPGDLPGMCASWARAAQISGDAAMKAKAQELVNYSLEWINQQNQPMNKVMGLADSTLADAVSLL